MRVVAAQDRKQLAELRRQLDPGEAEAIIVAVELRASLILIDEQRGRRVAAERGLGYMGLLGVLAEAKGRGLIPECKPILDGMIEQAGFWIGSDLRSRCLREIGEEPRD
jgi:predicted nucleic acid-binding protein